MLKQSKTDWREIRRGLLIGVGIVILGLVGTMVYVVHRDAQDEAATSKALRAEYSNPSSFSTNNIATTSEPTDDDLRIEMTPDDMTQYEEALRQPQFQLLRKAFNSYLQGGSYGMETKVGLDSFSDAYYRSRFVVLYVDPNPFGGENADIIFVDKPDRIFIAWLYQKDSGDWDFRGFRDKGVASSSVQRIFNLNRGYFLNQNLSL